MAIFHGTAIPSGGDFYDHPIEQSLRFNDGDSAYLSWTPASAGNRRTFTISCWVKVGTLNQEHYLYTAGTGGSGWTDIFRIYGDKIQFVLGASTSPAGQLYTAQVFRDLSAWYHLVAVVDTTNATSSERMRLYVNGERVTAFDTENYPSQNYEAYYYNTTYTQAIGRFEYYGSNYFDGYLAEVHFIDGTALDADSFGETKSGVWIPKEYTGSYGTNGFYLDFDGTYYNDKSGNSNNFTANNLAASDVVLDSPTNNFATLNLLDVINNGGTSSYAFSEGNLKFISSGSYYQQPASTINPTTGKWYLEAYIVSASSDYPSFYMRPFGGTSSAGQTFASLSASSTYGFAIDFDNSLVWKRTNGTWSGDPAAGTGGTSFSGNLIAFSCRHTPSNGLIANFGQDSSFAGTKTAQGNTDDNGYGDFYYAPPTGYLALCTANLEVPDAMNPALDNSPQDYFNTVLYTGTGSSNSVTGVGFQPDWSWFKKRNTAASHNIYDAVRGVQQRIKSDSTDAEDTRSGGLTSFDSDGFTVVSDAGVNTSGDTYVAWNWKANGSGVSNTDGSITSTVSANTGAGFSIVSFDFQSTGNQTIGHGLSSAPEFIIMKSRDSSDAWWVYHKSFGASYYYRLNTTTGATSNSGVWSTAPTSSVFTIGSLMNTSNYGTSQIAYCFHSVEGFSKFGKYIGNASGDGPFIYTGFRPAFVIIKAVSAGGSWFMFDNKRNGYNETEPYVMANSSNAESTDLGWDLLSNGFKLRHNYADTNTSGYNYMYMAFAENPFKYANAR